jgi:hypothetical protein
VLRYPAPHKLITDLTPTTLAASVEIPGIHPAPISADAFARADNVSLYAENLDLLSFYALAAQDQSIPLGALSSGVKLKRPGIQAGLNWGKGEGKEFVSVRSVCGQITGLGPRAERTKRRAPKRNRTKNPKRVSPQTTSNPGEVVPGISSGNIA